MSPKTLKFCITAVLLLLVAGCGTTGDVMKMGPDTYSVTASKHNMSGGAAAAQTNALNLANNKCETLSKEILVVNTSTSFDRPFYTHSVTFRCLEKNDPQLARPSYKKEPDVIIQDNRN